VGYDALRRKNPVTSNTTADLMAHVDGMETAKLW
jgi:hypothetical protein